MSKTHTTRPGVLVPKPEGFRDAIVRALVKTVWPDVVKHLHSEGVEITDGLEMVLECSLVATGCSVWELCEKIHQSDFEVPGDYADQINQVADELLAAKSNAPKVTVQ